jgi:hypothetical protein
MVTLSRPVHFLRLVLPQDISIRYLAAWLIIIITTAIDIVWMRTGGYSIETTGVLKIVKFSLQMLSVAMALNAIAQIPHYRKITSSLGYNRVSVTMAWLAVLSCFCASTSILSYFSVTVDAPLVDNSLIRFDSVFGYHWLALYHWVHAHPNLQRILELAYQSAGPQIIAIPIILGLTGRTEDLGNFVLLIIIYGIFGLLVATPFPSSSAFLHFNINDPNTVSAVSYYNLLRDGTMKTFDLNNAQGLVSMPSFHVALAIFFCYSLRHIGLLFPISIFLNSAMLIATPTQGAHYLADILGGAVLAVITIWVVQLLATSIWFQNSRHVN